MMIGAALIAKATGFLGGKWKWIAIIAAAVALSYVKGCSDGKSQMRAEYAAKALEEAQKDREADALAAKARLEDADSLEEFEDALVDSINASPDSVPDAASVALGCERLRAANVSPLPASCH